MSATPGWYTDPDGSGGWRWWDGKVWTGHTQPAGSAPSAVRSPQSALEDERGVVKWARLAILVYAGAMLVTPLLLWRMQALFRGILEGTVGPVEAEAMAEEFSTGWIQLPGWLQTLALIILLVWIYRAAVTAGRLGIPARRSPGWAVGAWFVPVINLWWPCQSLRDLLPHGHPTRQRITILWLAGILGGVVATVGSVMTFTGSRLGLTLASTGIVVMAGVLVAGRGVIADVLAVHEDMAASAV